MLLPLDMYHLVGHVETLEADLATIARRIWGSKAAQTFERKGRRTESDTTADRE